MLHEPRQVQQQNAATDVLESQGAAWVPRVTEPLRAEPARARKHSDTDPSYMHRGANAAGVSEHAQVTLDLRRRTGRLFRIVREFDRGPAVDRRHLADDRDRIEIG
jgi:hypothetical protein